MGTNQTLICALVLALVLAVSSQGPAPAPAACSTYSAIEQCRCIADGPCCEWTQTDNFDRKKGTCGETTWNAFIGGITMYVILAFAALFLYSWVYDGVNTKFPFWLFVILIIFITIGFSRYYSPDILQAVLYSFVLLTVAYRGFYAMFCLQTPTRFDGDRSSLGSRLD